MVNLQISIKRENNKIKLLLDGKRLKLIDIKSSTPIEMAWKLEVITNKD